MGQDLATLAPTVIVAAGFLIGVWMLLRRELAPKRRARRAEDSARDRIAEHRDDVTDD